MAGRVHFMNQGVVGVFMRYEERCRNWTRIEINASGKCLSVVRNIEYCYGIIEGKQYKLGSIFRLKSSGDSGR